MWRGQHRVGRGTSAFALALLVGACTAESEDEAPEAEAPDEVALATDVGITDEACPAATDPDNGCLYLGALSDLTDGPFAALGVEVVRGQRAFWDRVNDEGGIAGHDVDIDTYTRDNAYDVDDQLDHYAEIEPEVLALGLSFGTAPTEALLEALDADDVLAVPASRWSGWDAGGSDQELVLGSGASSCREVVSGLDWVADDQGEPASVLVIGFDSRYGEDAAGGAQAWADDVGAEFVGAVTTEPNAAGGSQDTAVSDLLAEEPDVVVLAVGPSETADIVGGAASQGYTGRFLGSSPTWTPALLDTGAAAALQALYVHLSPWEGLVEGDSEAHEAMREALGDELPENDGYTAGWVSSYPLLAVLEAAADAGDLTREGVRAAVEGVPVDYEGALPDRTLGDADADAHRTVVISRPDPDAELGLVTVAADATSEVDLEAPCVAP